ncbi:two-component system nitrogen regulation sensor histidine kinase GlnL [Inhella inkyongensis]|uniref:histidine kinase n=1 Tax=Inhella inkyongensis TaxID=392593 RepID=A0A840S594_9BURK|nr:nitrogen regulation protein NR(II) [Inhella inkyongensis]MBB5203680.1 two-component system nitrogen regulation sensor histidine kinase GlnL [Inhella inkyongensis]
MSAYAPFDLLATLVAVVRPDGQVLHANAAFEDQLRLSRRAAAQRNLGEWFVDARRLHDTLAAVQGNDFASARFEAQLRRGPLPHEDLFDVLVLVSQTEEADRLIVEMVEATQQARHEREERSLGQVRSSKDLVRNLAHEIKNPLGGLLGAAQLLALELGPGSELLEYTEVIVHEADRLQILVDRLLAPHRRANEVGDVNIHEVCERVRSLVLVEHPQGLTIRRDYDTSLPEFRGDREQLIQALLNLVQNAAQALAPQIERGEAQIVLRTRVARQVTLGKQRWRLALELHVEDNGPGVPAEIRDRLFFPLVTGREGGTGLGLHLAQTIVQAHQGLIDCDNQPGRTDFRITLPLP